MVCWILFFQFLKLFEKRKVHNMISLILNLTFKNLHLVFSFIGHEHGISIVKKYDNKLLYPMLKKYYHHLHSLANNGNAYIEEEVIENYV